MRPIKNEDIRLKAARSRVCLWQVAEELGITDATFSRKLRHELNEAEKERVTAAISRIAADNACHE